MNRFKLALVAIFILAFVLRYIGIYPGYNPYHPDEGTSYDVAIYMNQHGWKPDRFDYPAGMALLHGLIYRNIFIPISLLGLFITQPQAIHHFITADPKVFDLYGKALFGNRNLFAIYWSRMIAATIGGLAVILLYFVGKRLFTREIGLFAAFFLAVNYRHVLGSHFGLPDIHQSLFALLSLFACTLLLEKNTSKRYIFAGITAGLTFSFKYQPFVFLLPIFVHLVWTFRTRSFSYFFGKKAWIAALTAFATFLIINPYYFANIGNAFMRNRQDIGRYQIGVREIRLYPYFYLFHWGIDRLPSTLVILGALIMILRERAKFFLIFAFAGSFIIFMTYFSNGGIFPRNFVTPMPYLMLLAGFGFYHLIKFLIKSSPKSTLLILLILIAINWRPIKNDVILDINYSKPWNLNMLADWFDQVIPKNSSVRTYQLFFFMNYKGQDAIKRKNIKVLDWDYSKGPNSLAEFSKEKTDFAIIQLQSFQSVTYWWRHFPQQIWLLKYGEAPYDYILESFYGLTLRELLPHTVAEFYKPWQAASEFSFLVFKIPPPAKKLDRLVVSFRFKSTGDLWNPVDSFNFSPMTPAWDPNGKNDPGSMNIPPGGGDATTRVVSEPIHIAPGKYYTVSGWIKNATDKPENDDGFLRVDFYPDSSKKTLSLLSMDVALSQRATALGAWTLVQANARAPQGASFMTVSFQRKNPAYPYISYVDDVEVFESTPAPEVYPQIPVYRSSLKWQDAFYPSFL